MHAHAHARAHRHTHIPAHLQTHQRAHTHTLADSTHKQMLEPCSGLGRQTAGAHTRNCHGLRGHFQNRNLVPMRNLLQTPNAANPAPPRHTHAHAHTDNIDKECPNFCLLPSYVLHFTDRNLRPTCAGTHVHAPTWPAHVRGHSNACTPNFVTLCDTVLWNTDTNAGILRRQGLQRASAWHPSHLDVIIDKRHVQSCDTL